MKREYRVRPATEADIDDVMPMYDHSRSLMRAQGNTTQWVGYPSRAQLVADIGRGASFLIENEGRPIATFALVPGIEPTYGLIVHGRWIDNVHSYATIHRLACVPGVSGIAHAAFSYAKCYYSYLRFDTHESNPVLRHVADREDFVYSGIVFMGDGTERLAYEWWRWDEVDAALREYLRRFVLPRYDSFDAAHRREHVLRVIARSMLLGGRMGLEPDMLYTVAAMHDVGLAEGRERHHLASGRMVRADAMLRRWFDSERIETMAQAVEDHRASAEAPPRSLYGCVVAEADRDVEPERIVRRTVEFGISHYPDLDREGHWQRTLQHLHEKYAEGGYLKLWLPESPNAAPLAELRALIADEASLRVLFEQYYK